MEKLENTVHFGTDQVNFNDLHNELISIRQKINEIIEWINNHKDQLLN